MFTDQKSHHRHVFILKQASISIARSQPNLSQFSPTMTSLTPTVALISDDDLLRCSRHICRNVSTLAGPLGISIASLQEIKCNYEDVETQAYWVMKKWLEAYPNAHQKVLYNKLKILGFDNAAERYNCFYIHNLLFFSIA